MSTPTYNIITPAHNEAAFLPRVVEAIRGPNSEAGKMDDCG